MFCKKSGKELKIVIFGVIAVIIIIVAVTIVLAKRSGKEDASSETVESDTSIETETMAEDEISELPELAPDSEEEYEAFLDKLEYLTLGDEAENDGATVEEDFVAEDAGDIEDIFEDMTDSDESGAAIASALSTEDYAKAMEFEWLHDVMEADGTGAGIILDAAHADSIPADDNSYLTGGWKAYMYGTDSDYGERYMNAEIEAEDGKISVTLNWKYFCLEGNTYEEDGNSVFGGKRNPTDGVITAQSSTGNLELSEFYISKDKEHEYVVGAFLYPSGELYALGLMR